MADNLQKVPAKGILKSSSFDINEPVRSQKEMKWDEMNILQTLHPPGKDYGHMKISEPKTPYNYYKDSEDNDSREPKSDDEADGVNADLLAEKIKISSTEPPKACVGDDDDEDSEEDEDETDEQRAKRKVFEQKRKLHYNEFSAVKLARKLMEQDEEEDEDEDDKNDDDDDDNIEEDDVPSKSKPQTASSSSASHSSQQACSTEPSSSPSTRQQSESSQAES